MLTRNRLIIAIINELINIFKFQKKEKKVNEETSLLAQWLRICLPMQETRFRAVIWEDPTCRGATKPVCHNY